MLEPKLNEENSICSLQQRVKVIEQEQEQLVIALEHLNEAREEEVVIINGNRFSTHEAVNRMLVHLYYVNGKLHQ